MIHIFDLWCVHEKTFVAHCSTHISVVSVVSVVSISFRKFESKMNNTHTRVHTKGRKYVSFYFVM